MNTIFSATLGFYAGSITCRLNGMEMSHTTVTMHNESYDLLECSRISYQSFIFIKNYNSYQFHG